MARGPFGRLQRLSGACALVLAIAVHLESGRSVAAERDMTLWPVIDTGGFTDLQVSGLRDTEVRHRDGNEPGPGFLAGTTAGSGQVTSFSRELASPLDLSGTDPGDLYARFTFYVEDTEALSANGQLELTSAGRPDREEIHWTIQRSGIGPERIRNGWNTVLLPFSEAGTSGAPLALSRVGFARAFFFTDRPVDLFFGDLAVVSMGAPAFREDFASVSVLDPWTVEGAQRTWGGRGLRVTTDARQFELVGHDPRIALPRPGEMLLIARVMLEDRSAVTDLELLVGCRDTESYAHYAVPLGEVVAGEPYEFATPLVDFDHKDPGLSHFYEADAIGIRGMSEPGAVWHLEGIELAKAVDRIPRMIEDIGDLTFANVDARRSTVEQAEKLCSALAIPTAAHIASRIPNYLKLVAYRERIARLDAARASGLLLDLALDRELITGDEHVTAQMSITNVGEGAMADLHYEFDFDERIVAARGAASGSVSLQPGETVERRLELVPLEGGVAPVAVTVSAADHGSMGSLRRFVTVDAPGFFRADCHTHSIESDGHGSPAQNLKTTLENGAAILYATDHNADPGDRGDLDQAVDNLRSTGRTRFLALKGNEITSFVPGAGHMLHYGTETHYPAPSSQDMSANLVAYQRIIRSINAEGGFCYIAHPFLGGRNEDGTYHGWPFVSIVDGETDKLTGYTGLEIMNSGQNPQHFRGTTAPAVAFWDRMNRKGEQKYLAIANSDAHHPPHLNMTQNVFLMEAFTENRFLNALGTGRFYGTTGPDLRFAIDDRNMGETVIAAEPKTAALHVEARDTTPLQRVSLIRCTVGAEQEGARQETLLFGDPDGKTGTREWSLDTEIRLEPQTFYRLEVEAAIVANTMRIAYSNPIWVTPPATRLELDTDEIMMRAGERVRMDIQTDNVYDSVRLESSAPEILSVLDNGVLKADPQARGTFRVRVLNTSGRSVGCTVHVR